MAVFTVVKLRGALRISVPASASCRTESHVDWMHHSCCSILKDCDCHSGVRKQASARWCRDTGAMAGPQTDIYGNICKFRKWKYMQVYLSQVGDFFQQLYFPKNITISLKILLNSVSKFQYSHKQINLTQVIITAHTVIMMFFFGVSGLAISFFKTMQFLKTKGLHQ